MSYKMLTIEGFRGFSNQQSLRFAQPTGEAGSGMTVLVGPNNGGKSTIVESLQALSSREVSFPERSCNRLANGGVLICIECHDIKYKLRTVGAGRGQAIWAPDPPGNCYVLPSRRFFNPFFGSGLSDRGSYIASGGLPSNRSTTNQKFSRRLFDALPKRAEFNEVLKRVVDCPPPWTIVPSEQGEYFLRIESDGGVHNSDGLGEGIISLLFIVDALYDSNKGDLIAIDEPELSLHPVYQRRLAVLLTEYAKDRQIVYATHSPYFVDFSHVVNGAEVARVHKRAGSSVISQLSRESAGQLKGILTDSHSPHVLGLDAREVFFQEDGIIVVEVPQHVVYYPTVLNELVDGGKLTQANASHLRERFFGWGAGGAEKIEKIVALLCDLGFQQVAAIFD